MHNAGKFVLISKVPRETWGLASRKMARRDYSIFVIEILSALGS
jgi:hypothetical protein